MLKTCVPHIDQSDLSISDNLDNSYLPCCLVLSACVQSYTCIYMYVQGSKLTFCLLAHWASLVPRPAYIQAHTIIPAYDL